MAMKPIQILINAKDNASGVFDKLQTKVAAVGVVIAGYFGIQAFKGVVQGAADLEQAMSRVQAATGATAEEMVQLRAAAEGAASGTKFTAVDTAAALENLAKAGLSASEAIATLPAATALAQAGDIELAQSAEFLTKAVMGMGLAFSDAGRVADVLALGANATNTSVTGLAQALSYAAPVAQSLGLSLESTVAIIGKFADAGIDASRAGTALNSILSQFSNPATKFRQELAAAGITTTNFEDALRQLAASSARGERAINAIGQEAGPALRALLNQGMGSLDELGEKLRNAEGSAAATAATMRNNLTGAMGGLRSAWDAVSNALGTPVLPVLQAGVEKLTGALSGAVKDGTVAKFGQAIATAFEGAIKWAQGFAASFDVEGTIARLQAFAGEAQQTFAKVGEWASSAGNVVKLAYGVMSGGVNGVLTAIYGIGSVFAEVGAVVMAGVAKLRDGLASITFGSLSDSFKLAAEDARSAAQGFGDAAQAMRDKAADALQDTANAAQLARDGFAGLAGAADRTVGAVESTVQGLDGVAAAATGAADKLVDLKKTTDASTKSAADHARAQKEAAAAIAAAFERAGIQTKDALQVAAATALSDFETIRNSGQATAAGLSEAWKRAADAAISAGNGVVPAWVKAQAAVQGYDLVIDKAGQSTLRLKSAQDAAVQGAHSLASAINRVTDARERDIEARERAIALREREAELERKRLGVDQAGFAADEKGNRITAGSELTSLTGIAAFLKSAGVDDDKKARAIAMEFADAYGNVTYMGNKGQAKYGGDTISVALLRAAERETFGIGGTGRSAPGSTIPKPESSRNVRVDLNFNGQNYGAADMDGPGAENFERFLAALGQAKTTH